MCSLFRCIKKTDDFCVFFGLFLFTFSQIKSFCLRYSHVCTHSYHWITLILKKT